MREIDIYVGQKYRVKEDVASYIKRGAVVVIRKKDGEFYRVQDLSKNKYLDGRWWLHYSRLEPLKGIDVVNLQKYIYQKILKIFKLNLSKRHR